MPDKSVMPGVSSDIGGVKPPTSVMREISYLRSEVNYLRARVEKAEKAVSNVSAPSRFQESVQGVLNTAWTRDFIISTVSGMDGSLLPVHYHSVLVNPETSNVAFSVDGDGGFIYQFTSMRLKVKIDPANMTRIWYAWNTATSDWSAIGDEFSVSL